MPESTAPTVPSLTPHLVCRGATEAIDFYQRAFGAVEEIQAAAREQFGGCGPGQAS